MPTQSLQTFAPSLGRNTEFGLEESPASRAFGTLLMMTAWYTSSISIWYHAARFLQDKTIQVERFSTEETGSFECHEEDAAAILQVITSRKPDCEAISALQRAARAATIHAEAALMGYAFYDQSKEISSALQLPVGVSHKCCHLCWLLKKELNDHPTAKDLLLPGTHSQFLPWIPPFGVSDCTLQSLRIKLLVIIRSRLRQERALSGMVGYTGISPFT
ncbi:hypothetical protein F5890DRAFT_655906 [Lentinula detonsa]|uniref:Uncharacterized protein n=1 Tax=Lentinula detonsa TaxID=2804962 RepID=A0AA38UQV8_9AGAR|nr:hypothetical protein F5890DRAFT_655906 [Lentinula detonsa]